VPQVTLDGHFRDQRVDLLKLDIEGYEIEALHGARRLLAGRQALAIEVHVAQYADRERQVAELFGVLDLPAYDASIQLDVDGPLERFDPAVHTPQYLARHSNVHWLAVPRARAG